MRFFFNASVLMLVLSLSFPGKGVCVAAEVGGSDGGGGSMIAAKFVLEGLKLAEALVPYREQLPLWFSLTDFNNELESASVIAVDKITANPRHHLEAGIFLNAYFDRNQSLIQLLKGSEITAIIKDPTRRDDLRHLILHEFLGLLGLEAHGKYARSAEILLMMGRAPMAVEKNTPFSLPKAIDCGSVPKISMADLRDPVEEYDALLVEPMPAHWPQTFEAKLAWSARTSNAAEIMKAINAGVDPNIVLPLEYTKKTQRPYAFVNLVYQVLWHREVNKHPNFALVHELVRRGADLKIRKRFLPEVVKDDYPGDKEQSAINYSNYDVTRYYDLSILERFSWLPQLNIEDFRLVSDMVRAHKKYFSVQTQIDKLTVVLTSLFPEGGGSRHKPWIPSDDDEFHVDSLQSTGLVSEDRKKIGPKLYCAYFDKVKYLQTLEKKVNLPIHWFAQFGEWDAVESLRALGADITLAVPQINGWTVDKDMIIEGCKTNLLHILIQNRLDRIDHAVEMAEYLISQGVRLSDSGGQERLTPKKAVSYDMQDCEQGRGTDCRRTKALHEFFKTIPDVPLTRDKR